MGKCGFVTYVYFNDLDTLHEVETDSVQHQTVSPMLGKSRSDSRSAWVQASSAHDVLCKNDIEEALKFMSSFKAPAAYSYSSCCGLMFLHVNKSSRRPAAMVEDAKADPEGLKEMLLFVFEVYYLALTHMKKPLGVHS